MSPTVTNFRGRTEIEEFVAALFRMMQRWGLKPNEWMLGKNLSLYFEGVFLKPAELQRDTTVHVLKNKLSWKVREPVIRSVVPRTYPEIFKKQKTSKEFKGVVQGKVAAGSGIVIGEVELVEPGKVPPKGRIFLFSHFRPVDSALAEHAKAIITDGGGILSHAAVICREYKVPCVVDTKNASKVFATGDRVRIDLKSGTITKAA